MSDRRIGLFMYGLTGGGVARRMVTLARGFAERGDQVDLLLVRAGNPGGIEVDPRVRLMPLGGWRVDLPWIRQKRRRQFRQVRGALAAYLRHAAPDALIAADNYANLTAIEARRQAGAATPLIVTQRTHTSTFVASKLGSTARSHLIERTRALYPLADAVIGVSAGVSADLVAMGLPAGRVRTIYNPVVGAETAALAAGPVDHPWFRPGQPPVILGVGRITPQKDFSTLLRAFARLIAAGRDLRLVILGAEKSADDKGALLALAAAEGVAERLDLPGSVPAPHPYMARSALYVLSSRWEGLPATLIEALACGTPAVSTDCPSGPREVLEDGALGPLVPVGDHQALAAAMAATLDRPPDRERLVRSTDRFSTKAAVDAYSCLVDDFQPQRCA